MSTWVFIPANYASDDMESYPVGSVASLDAGISSPSVGWSADGRFVDEITNYAGDDMESYPAGAISSLTNTTSAGDTSLGNGRFV